MQILKTITSPTKLIDKAKLGMRGFAGYAAATVALEAGTQLFEKFVEYSHNDTSSIFRNS